MRIIGGEAKGRVVHLPPGSRIRPTTDRVKESLFNILRSVEGSTFLDLFAGSGNVGLEALSRGARFATFVEKDIRLVRALQASIAQLGFGSMAEVIANDAEAGLKRIVQKGDRFDIIFADPPYDQGMVGTPRRKVSPVPEWPDMRKVLAENGIIVIQHSVREKPEELRVQPWMVADQRRYGDTVLTFLKENDL
ncbi:MAG: 16S rRNA (guanine(966)-N(2))-methyltransferase RsmD [Syntrophales bacterium]